MISIEEVCERQAFDHWGSEWGLQEEIWCASPQPPPRASGVRFAQSPGSAGGRGRARCQSSRPATRGPSVSLVLACRSPWPLRGVYCLMLHGHTWLTSKYERQPRHEDPGLPGLSKLRSLNLDSSSRRLGLRVPAAATPSTPCCVDVSVGSTASTVAAVPEVRLAGGVLSKISVARQKRLEPGGGRRVHTFSAARSAA